MTATWKAEFFCKQKCPTPTQQYSPVCPLYFTTSVTVMPKPLPLASHVLSGRVRDSLVNCHFYHSLSYSYITGSEFQNKKTKQINKNPKNPPPNNQPKKDQNKIKILFGAQSPVPNKKSQSIKLGMFLKCLIFVPIHSQVQHELFSF